MAKMTDEQQYIRMTETPVSKLVTSLAVPTVAGMLVSSIYNITDTFSCPSWALRLRRR